MWLNWYLCQWDLFIDSMPEIKEKLIKYSNKNKSQKSSLNSDDTNKIIYFKKADEKSYIYYRQATQLIDALLTDYNHLKLQQRHLIAAVIFIVISLFYEFPFFTQEQFPTISFNEDFFIQLYKSKEFGIIINQVFGEFLSQSFNFTFEDIIPACVYCSNYVFFEFTFDLPLIIQLKNEQFENVKFFSI